MGLDISAYSKVEFLKTMGIEDWEEEYWKMSFKTTIAAHWEGVFADRAEPIIDGGVYKINGESFDFRAGSYTGYNSWRDQLSWIMLGVSARTVWQNRDAYKGKPFYELIDFSDAEGVIGSVVAAKLAKDFADYQSVADAYSPEHDWNGWWKDKYADWRKAFELAADNGMVEFH